MALGKKEDMRVLLALSNGQAADGARGVFKQIGANAIKAVEDKKTALEALGHGDFNFLLVEDTFSDLGGLDFCRFVRMVNKSVSYAPQILCMKAPDKAKVMQARDAGINKIILMPFTTGSLIKTVQDMMLYPRPFVQISGYDGPCRRHTAPAVRTQNERRKEQEGLIDIPKLQSIFKGMPAEQ